MTSRKVTPTRVGLTVVGATVFVAAGVLAGIAYTTPAVPSGLESPAGSSTFPVGETSFDDARSVTLSVAHSEATQLTSPVAGRVTATSCAPGKTLMSGSAPVWLDGAPLIALSTSTPLWRSLVPGDKGEDVKALQEELVRLGLLSSRSGQLDKATLSAFHRLRKSVGDPATTSPTAAISVDRILWLPAASTDVESCAAPIGGTLVPGDEIARVPGRLTSLSVVDVPTDLVVGPRVLTVDGTRIDIDPATPLSEPERLLPLTSLPSLRPREDTDEPPAAVLALASPVTVSVVPPSAVVGTSGPSCVVADGVPIPVRVLASELGQSLVAFDREAPADVEVDPPGDTTCG